MNPWTLNAALRAAGAAVKATDLVLSGEVPTAFCSVRPPGHHAEHAAGMGFCFFNNTAVGIRHALDVHGLSRVALIDFDVHHGNGSEDIFKGDERVLMCSIFEKGLYPFNGEEAKGLNMVNVGLPSRSGGDKFREAVTDYWMPALDAFRPELIYISAGFDAHREDDMGNLGLVEADYEWVTKQLMQVPTALQRPHHFLPGGRLRAEPAGAQRGCPRQGPDRRRLIFKLTGSCCPDSQKARNTLHGQALPQPAFFSESIAVFAGQWDDPTTQTPQAQTLLTFLRAQRFSGTLTFLDIHTTGTLADLAQTRADLAIIALPHEDVAAALDIAGRIKCRAAVVISTGINATLASELNQLARHHGMYLLARIAWASSDRVPASMPVWPDPWPRRVRWHWCRSRER
jgi:hypothetical protein